MFVKVEFMAEDYLATDETSRQRLIQQTSYPGKNEQFKSSIENANNNVILKKRLT